MTSTGSAGSSWSSQPNSSADPAWLRCRGPSGRPGGAGSRSLAGRRSATACGRCPAARTGSRGLRRAQPPCRPDVGSESDVPRHRTSPPGPHATGHPARHRRSRTGAGGHLYGERVLDQPGIAARCDGASAEVPQQRLRHSGQVDGYRFHRGEGNGAAIPPDPPADKASPGCVWNISPAGWACRAGLGLAS